MEGSMDRIQGWSMDLGSIPSDTAGQPFTYLLSPYRSFSERLTSRVQIRCKQALKNFEYLNIHRCFSAMDTRWTLKLGQREVSLSVWPSPEFERD